MVGWGRRLLSLRGRDRRDRGRWSRRSAEACQIGSLVTGHAHRAVSRGVGAVPALSGAEHLLRVAVVVGPVASRCAAGHASMRLGRPTVTSHPVVCGVVTRSIAAPMRRPVTARGGGTGLIERVGPAPADPTAVAHAQPPTTRYVIPEHCEQSDDEAGELLPWPVPAGSRRTVAPRSHVVAVAVPGSLVRPVAVGNSAPLLGRRLHWSPPDVSGGSDQWVSRGNPMCV